MREYKKDGLSYRYATLSEMGLVRENNEDALLVLPEAGLFGVCDGLGGHAGGEVASALAAEVVSREVGRDAGQEPQEVLARAIREANRRIREVQTGDRALRGMATTLSLVWLRPCAGTGFAVAHVGDSRIYMLRDETLRQITEDHSPVFELFKKGMISKREMHRHPQKNLIDKCLGIYPFVEPDILQLAAAAGDRLLISSDGLTDCLTDDDIERVLRECEFDSILGRLRDDVYRAGAPDNITMVLVEITRMAEATRR